jgi:Holliday junction resolvasome RuvABC endonuclease subunit
MDQVKLVLTSVYEKVMVREVMGQIKLSYYKHQNIKKAIAGMGWGLIGQINSNSTHIKL